MVRETLVRSMAALAILCACTIASAQPTNDICASARTVSDGITVDSNVGANDDGSASCESSPGSGASVWYVFTAPFNGEVRIETCGSSFDTVVSVFGSCGGAETHCDNDSGCPDDFTSAVSVPMIGGNQYFIRVAGLGTGAEARTGDIVLSISSVSDTGSRPSNDDCGAAPPATVGTVNGSNVAATTDDSASCAISGADVWYEFTPTTSGQYTIDTCNSAFDTVLAVFNNCLGGTELACSDDGAACGATLSSLTLNATAGTRYFIRVAGKNGATGSFSLTISNGDNGNTNGNNNGNTNGNDNTGGNTNDNTGGNGNDNTGGNSNDNTGGNDNGGGNDNAGGNDNSGGNDNAGGNNNGDDNENGNNDDGNNDDNGNGIPDDQECGALCPSGAAATLAFTLMGIIGMKVGSRRGVRRRR